MKCLRTCDKRCVGLRGLQTCRLQSSASNGFTQPCHSCSEKFVPGLSEGRSLLRSAGDSADATRELKQQIQGCFSPFHACAHWCLVCSPQQWQWLMAVKLALFWYLVLSSCVPNTTSLTCGSFRPSVNKNHWTSLFLIAM